MSTKPQKQASEPAGTPPIAKVRVGLVTASIWERDTEKGRYYSATFERRYRTKDGQWQTSHAYDAHDLLALAKAADLAYNRIAQMREIDDSPDDQPDGE